MNVRPLFYLQNCSPVALLSFCPKEKHPATGCTRFDLKKMAIVFILCTLLPLLCFSQRSKKRKGSTVFVSTAINYYPAIEPYSFFSSFTDEDDDLILTFLTANSGKFVIEEGQALLVMRENRSAFPSQLLGVGASVQVLKSNSLFHEVSLTKLSSSKSSYTVNFTTTDSVGARSTFQLGYEQKASAFGFRYEVGKYFGDPKRANLRFGISGGIEPSFYFYKRTPFSSNEFPLRARIFTVEVSVVPMLSAKLSKRLAMDFKVIPNMLLGDFGSIEEQNPLLPLSQQAGERDYNLPEISMAFSLLLRYVIKEPKK